MYLEVFDKYFNKYVSFDKFWIIFCQEKKQMLQDLMDLNMNNKGDLKECHS